MSIVVDAIYEEGILKVLSPLPALPEHTPVRVTIEVQGITSSLRFPAELMARIAERRAAILQRSGLLGDSNDLIREAREQELA
jgi:predicted DNA-binding antitoxin AbrB/MazE fold protein